MIRFLCKKQFDFTDGTSVKRGDVVHVTFCGKEASVSYRYSYDTDTSFKSETFDDNTFKEHFIMYDDIGTANPMDYIKMVAFLFGRHYKEKEIIRILGTYIHERHCYLKESKKNKDEETE